MSIGFSLNRFVVLFPALWSLVLTAAAINVSSDGVAIQASPDNRVSATGGFEQQFARPLGTMMQELSARFGVKLKVEVDTVGKQVPWADFRIRPYSLDESLSGILSLYDYRAVKQADGSYKIRPYEYMRRTPDDGRKMLNYLNTLYTDKESWEKRRACLRSGVREALGWDAAVAKLVANPDFLLSEPRAYDGYQVRNFALETLPGYYVTGLIYLPKGKGPFPLLLMPNGHWVDGRYNADEQTRFATLARMGVVSVSYDLFGWGESALMVGAAAHRTSTAQVVQLLNGVAILDFFLNKQNRENDKVASSTTKTSTTPEASGNTSKRSLSNQPVYNKSLKISIDPTRIGANGGSGGGSQVIMLGVLDDRIAAACPTVNLASHFDGGCPCESGMPVSLACDGTNNAELAATFAPKPLRIISDDKDWTASVPSLEFPYLQRIYGFYQQSQHSVGGNAAISESGPEPLKAALSNVHLAGEGHDFGVNKRKAVYEFFAGVFQLKNTLPDESKVTIESKELMFSFGAKGEQLPANAVRSLKEVDQHLNKKTAAAISSDLDIEKKVNTWLDSLKLNDAAKEARVRTVLIKHQKIVRDWHNEHPYTSVPAGINPLNGKPLSDIDREVIANSGKPASVHSDLMDGLRKDLTESQVETILDFYTIGKVAFTLRGFKAIVPDMTATEEAYIVQQLKLAREQAVDYKRMKAISAIFEIYKTNCEQYLNTNGRNWRKLYKAYVDSLR